MNYQDKKELLLKMIKEGMGKKFTYNGYECQIKRHPSLFHLCGYVAVDKEHLLYGKHYNDIYSCEEGDALNVHGGLTYSGEHEGLHEFGFDCTHLGDVAPYKLLEEYETRFLHNENDVYRDMDYVEKEVKILADWIKKKE